MKNNTIEFLNTVYFQDVFKDFYQGNRVAAVATFLYDLEDSCQDNFLKFGATAFTTDRVNIGRLNVIKTIQNIAYPAKLTHFTGPILGYGVDPSHYWELVDLHGLNQLTLGPGIDRSALWTGYHTIERGDDGGVYNSCQLGVEALMGQNLDYASNLRSLAVSSPFRQERTPILEIDKSKSLTDTIREVVPQGAIAPQWKKENTNEQETPNWISLGSNRYTSNQITWTTDFGISWQELIDESIPLFSTDVVWFPIGKETKKMGYVSYTAVENYLSPEIEYTYFTNLLPEHAANNVNFDPDFLDRISPTGCTNRQWHPIGKQPQVMGLECWTAVGFYIIPLYEDHCTSDPIEIDQRGTVQKHPVHINDHFKHLYDLRKGKLSCDFHIPSYSDLMEIDQYSSFSLPNGAYGKTWNYLYDQKDGKILFSNTAEPTSFMTISGNTNANLAGQKERGYFEYLIKNN